MSYDGRPKKGSLVQYSSMGAAPDSVIEQGVVIETGRWTKSETYNLTVLTADGIQTWKMCPAYPTLSMGEADRWMGRRGHRLIPKRGMFLKVLESN